jgi:5-methylcytosine-specific restriction endonuclease McrA
VERDGARCEWCGLEFAAPLSEATLDHVVPLARGGTNKRKNLVLACRPCNEQRGSSHTAPQVRRLGGLPSRQ